MRLLFFALHHTSLLSSRPQLVNGVMHYHARYWAWYWYPISTRGRAVDHGKPEGKKTHITQTTTIPPPPPDFRGFTSFPQSSPRVRTGRAGRTSPRPQCMKFVDEDYRALIRATESGNKCPGPSFSELTILIYYRMD